MAKVELRYGKDPVMRRLTQEILVDQQSETDAMPLWLNKTKTVRGKIYVGRSPHEAFFRPDGRELWVAVRGGLDVVLVYRRNTGSAPTLAATIKTGDLPHGVWGSGDGGWVYVGLENGDGVQAINTLTDQVVAAPNRGGSAAS